MTKIASKFLVSGIEGWLKVETARQIFDLIDGFQNTGPDIRLKNGAFIELKGATNCSPYWVLSGLKYECPHLACLFLGSHKSIATRIPLLEVKSRIVGHKRFFAGDDSGDEWIAGLIVKKTQSSI